MKHLVTDIQHFSLHDGPGIRTTVFFKGCPLNCKWCHNPEAIAFKQDLLFYSQLCTACGKCEALCPEKCIALSSGGELLIDRKSCTLCGLCGEACVTGALELKGRDLSAEEIVDECLMDRAFYKKDGGVTLSGGEVLMQGDFIISLMKSLKAEGLHLVLDSCGLGDRDVLEGTLPYTDLYYYDLKCMDPGLHKQWCGTGNTLILDNLEFLLYRGAPVTIRIPLVAGFNDSLSEMETMASYLSKAGEVLEVHFLPYHSLGNSKYAALGREAQLFQAPDKTTLETLSRPFKEKKIPVKIFK